MIKKIRIPIFLLLLGSFFVVNEEKVSAFAEGPENQAYCFYGGVYQKETDSCVSIFRKTSSTIEPDIFKDRRNRDIKVISILTIKKGDSCIKVTKLSLQECILLARENNRRVIVYFALSGERTFIVPFNIGEQIAFVRYIQNGETRVKYILSKKR